jgi:putative membrane protein
MLLDAAFSFAHFAAVLLVVGTLSAETFVIRLPMNASVIALLARADRLYAIGAVLVIAAGLGRVFYGLKDASYYAGQPFFWAKMAAFALIGVISIWPTIKFLSWRKASKADETFAPPAGDVKTARVLLMVEVHLLILVPLFAALMARGIGR